MEIYDNITCPTFCEIWQKICQHLADIWQMLTNLIIRILAKLDYISMNRFSTFAKRFNFGAVQKCANRVDLRTIRCYFYSATARLANMNFKV